MRKYMLLDFLFYFFTIGLLFFFVVTLFNYLTAPKLEIPDEEIDESRLVSILIPARNEEKSISQCLLSAINQTYKNIEIIVLDDNSTDKTSEIIERLIGKYPQANVKHIMGDPLEDGWSGKNWACHQLYKKANGEVLLFIDADVYLSPEAVRAGVSALNNNLDALTVFSRQIMRSFWEKTLVDFFMNWLVASMLPTFFVDKVKSPALSAGNGQYFIYKREAYEKIGGHEQIKDHIVEDREFGYMLKSVDLKLGVFHSNNLVYCRMYQTKEDTINGFTKNFYIGSKMTDFLYFIFMIGLPMLYIMPIVLILFDWKFLIPTFLIILQKGFQAKLVKNSILESIIYTPAQFIAMSYVGFRSYFNSKKNNIEWKGRKVSVELQVNKK